MTIKEKVGSATTFQYFASGTSSKGRAMLRNREVSYRKVICFIDIHVRQSHIDHRGLTLWRTFDVVLGMSGEDQKRPFRVLFGTLDATRV